MLPDRVSNPGPLTYESGALSTALRAKHGGTALLELGYCLAAQGPSPPSYLRPKSKFKASPLHTAFPYHPYIVMI